MEWDKSQIRTASFKGVEFRCVVTAGVRRAKRYRSVEYPNRPGGQVWDGARRPVTIDMTALFLDDEYPGVMNDLIDAFDSIGPGTLVHPTRGEIWALCVQCDEDTSGNTPNSATLKLSFIEAAQGENAWRRVIEIQNPEARAVSLSSNLDTALGLDDPDSFSYHAGFYLAALSIPSVTLQYIESLLSATIQTIEALALTIDISSNPLMFDYVAEASTLGRLLIEATDMRVGQQANSKLYLVKRTMTLLDIAADVGCTMDAILQYNSVPNPCEVMVGTYLIVPA